jgi:endonuclease/exonuclease/phosphatase family metal-dependent hydrolase
MKLISLNVWGGKLFEDLMKFIEDESRNTDIFVFQEMFHTNSDLKWSNGSRANLHFELSQKLQGFKSYFAPAQDGFDIEGSDDFNLSYGLSLFVKSGINPESYKGDFFVYGIRNDRNSGDNSTNPRNLQYVNFKLGGRDCTVAHFHGLWNGKGKTDTEERLDQSKKVRHRLDKMSGDLILCGDFNLKPETESLAILGKEMNNLITKYGITDTRSSHYLKMGRYGDYMLKSPGIKVEKFEVLKIDVSDHLPLVLEFS